MAPRTEEWTLTTAGRQHVVVVQDTGWRREIGWSYDGVEVARTRTSDERVTLVDKDGLLGAVGLRFPSLVGPARRVTLYEGDATTSRAAALVGLGGTDLDPDPGSRAARRAAWIDRHPRLYTARQTAVAAGTVVGALVLTALLARLVVTIPWPSIELPRLPLPDLPDIPWPDIPWPDWQRPAIPEWLRQVAESAKYVAPVLIAFALARAEIRRRRTQDAKKRAPAG